MKCARIRNRFHCLERLVSATICLLPTLASAHPGHYHPDETDEFDFFRATFLHSHGGVEYVLAGLVVINIVVVCLSQKPAVRFAAFGFAMAAISAISVF